MSTEDKITAREQRMAKDAELAKEAIETLNRIKLCLTMAFQLSSMSVEKYANVAPYSILLYSVMQKNYVLLTPIALSHVLNGPAVNVSFFSEEELQKAPPNHVPALRRNRTYDGILSADVEDVVLNTCYRYLREGLLDSDIRPSSANITTT